VAPVRITFRLTLGIFILLTSFAGHGLWRLFGLNSPWPRFFLIGFGRAMGLRVDVRGIPVPGHVLYVANHLSWLDILAIGSATGSAFVAKSDIDAWPVVGPIARIGGTIFVDRESRRAARGQADQIGEALQDGKPITLFPEGTTNDGTRMLPFRPALFASVAPAPVGIAVQPVAIDYQDAAADIAWCGDEPLAPNARRVMARRGGLKVVLHFLPPLAPSTDRKLLAAQSTAAIEQALTPSA
jgi:1-acyl-sn-glycerol-3-phosphate acyltransferase